MSTNNCTKPIIRLPATAGTTELDKLNKEITNLINSKRRLYVQRQKQLAENASHEIRAPWRHSVEIGVAYRNSLVSEEKQLHC